MIETLTGLLAVLVWPTISALVLLYCARPLRKLIKYASELTLKAAGMEASSVRSRGASMRSSRSWAATGTTARAIQEGVRRR